VNLLGESGVYNLVASAAQNEDIKSGLIESFYLTSSLSHDGSLRMVEEKVNTINTYKVLEVNCY